jgi:hypothetical protein
MSKQLLKQLGYICILIAVIFIIWYFVNESRNVRYIKISQKEGCLHFSRIRVYSENEEISGNALVTSSSVYGDNPGMWGMSNLIKKQDDTSYAHTQCGGNEYIEVDLRKGHNLDRITLLNRVDECCRKRSNGVVVSLLNEKRKVVREFEPLKDETGSSVYNTTSGGGVKQFDLNCKDGTIKYTNF